MTGNTVPTESLQRETVVLDEQSAAEAAHQSFIVAELVDDAQPVLISGNMHQCCAARLADRCADANPGRRFGVFRLTRFICREPA